MKLQEWETWYTYSTYLVKTPPELDRVAVELIKTGLTRCVALSSGRAFWEEDSKVLEGHYFVSLSRDFNSAQIKLDPKPQNDFIVESLLQAAQFKYSEEKLFVSAVKPPRPFLRAYLDECNLIKDSQYSYIVYPIVTLFSNGIVLLELRLIGSSQEIEVSEFIDSFVNIFQDEFSQVLVAPALAHIYLQKVISEDRNRFSENALMERVDNFIRESSSASSESTFDFLFVSLLETLNILIADEGTKVEEIPSVTITNLAHTILNAFAFSMVQPRSGFGLRWMGQRRTASYGSSWIARPQMHIIRHEGQAANTRENEMRHASDFGKILSSINEDNPDIPNGYLPKNLRNYGDFGAYIASHASLWVWSQKGLDNNASGENLNLAKYVYENQLKAEILDYGYILYRKFLDLNMSLKKTDDVLGMQRELISFERSIVDTNRFGEMKDFFVEAWKNLGLDELKAHINALLDVKLQQTMVEESRKTNRVNIALTIVVGIVATSYFSDGIAIPLWKHYQWPLFGEETTLRLWINASVIVIIILFLVVSKFIKKRKDKGSSP